MGPGLGGHSIVGRIPIVSLPWYAGLWRLALLLLVLGLLAAGVVVVAMLAGGRRRPEPGVSPPARASEASRILDERYARGEIDDDEYRRRKATLLAG